MSLEDRTKEWERLYREGRTLAEIANLHGVSRQRVHQVLKPLRLARPSIARPSMAQVRMPSPSRGKKIWSVYVMAADGPSTETYFKVGISSDVVKRVFAVQTTCPFQISTLWAITAFNNGAAQILEKKLHALLWPYRTSGEWFLLDTANPDHKRAINEAFAFAVKACSNMAPMKWRRLSVAQARKLTKEVMEERRRQSPPVHGYDVWSKHRAGIDNWPA